MALLFNAVIPRLAPSNPGSIVPAPVAKDMIEAYKNAHNASGTRTIYADFDMAKMIAFLGRFNGANGIRIYNGLSATGKHTFIIVPTITVGDNNCRIELPPIYEPDGDEAAGFDFATLCPPGGNCNCECDGVNGNPLSLARQVYGNLICPPPTP